MLIDLFVCVNRAAGGYTVPDLIKVAKERGLDGMLLVDRAIPVSQEAVQAGIPDDFRVFVGTELETDHGVVLLVPNQWEGAYANRIWGDPHINEAYSLSQILEIARTHRWATIAVQPFDHHFPRSAGEELIRSEGISAVMVNTGATPLLAHDNALESAMARQLPAVAGSNTRHSFNRLGVTASAFARPLATQGDLVEALLEGFVWTASFGSSAPPATNRSSAFQGEENPRKRPPRRREREHGPADA